ncbi:MAG: C4-dicarboxylate transporter DcuC [Bacteroidales bacterium]|nr:C4-dicarboxylate transporter DcuC [Bacteroidales bacterium]
MDDGSVWLSVAIVGAAVLAVFRGVDVRLALFTGALALGIVAGDPSPVVRTFLETFSNEKFVVPICTAMGFAYVLKLTGCDQHLVRLLMHPLRYVRFLMVPGVVLVGFLVNIPVISQTSTAVCLGTVVVPLMRAAGFAPVTIGAALLLGASIGGELLNPGAPELLTVSSLTGEPTPKMWPDLLRLVIPQLFVATFVLWLMELRSPQTTPQPTDIPSTETPSESPLPPEESIHVLKAAVPLIPLLLLFLAGPPLNLLPVPQKWVVNRPPAAGTAAVGGGAGQYAIEQKPDKSTNTRLIGLAMLIGVAAAAAASPGRARGCMKAFFDGAGTGFTQIISLIVTANCFGKGIEISGLSRHLEAWITGEPTLLHPLAGFIPAGFGFICGSGMATTQSLYGFFYGPAVELGADPVSVGAMVSVGSAAGRTMSPVAAVVLMSAALTDTKPFDLVKRVAPPLLIGLTVIVILRVMAWV